MSEERRRVLELLAQGKVTVEEAEQLLAALGQPRAEKASPSAGATAEGKPRYLRIEVHKAANEYRPQKDVVMRVPVPFMRSGLRLGAVIPGFAGERLKRHLRDRGIDVDLETIEFAQLDAMLSDLGEMTFDVDNGKQQVRLRYE